MYQEDSVPNGILQSKSSGDTLRVNLLIREQQEEQKEEELREEKPLF